MLTNWGSSIKYARKIFQKITFLTPWYTQLLFRKILRAYLIDGLLQQNNGAQKFTNYLTDSWS